MFSGNNPNGEGFNSLKQFGFGMHNLSRGAAAATLNANGPGGSGSDIDWAQLAQQWIQMRDTNAAATTNMNLESQNYCLPAVPPPPPIISTMAAYKAATTMKQNKHHHSSYEEKGEADMEMDEEIEVDECADANEPTPPAAPIITQQQWYSGGLDSSNVVETAINHHNHQWNVWPPRVNVPPPPVISNAAVTGAATSPTAHIPSLLKINVTNPNAPAPYNHVSSVVSGSSSISPPGVIGITQSGNGTDVPYSNNSGIDANKRKMLPAWIREGLEKMEREKQKQMERQQYPKSKDSSYNDEYENTITASHPNPNHSPPVNLLQNIANSASESESGNESEDHHTDYYDDDDVDKDNDAAIQRSTSHSSMDRNKQKQQRRNHHKQQQQSNDLIGKSYEQKHADLMFVVRRTLTELLLETTNEEIANVAHDVIKAHRKKASSAQVIRKSALSSITGKLGLAAYADSSSDDNSADDSDNEDFINDDDDNKRAGRKSDNSYDSGEDLKATIRNKKRAFAKTIEEIEKNVAQAEEREEQQLKYFKQLEKDTQNRKYDDLELNKRSIAGRAGGSSVLNSKSTNNDFGETTTTTTDSKLKQQFNGKRMNRKERTTRFSDNKDGKNTSASAYNAAATSYLSHLQTIQQQQSAITTTTTTSNGNIGGGGGGGVGTSNSIQQQQKSMPIPNPATSLLQMPESLARYTAAATTNSGVVNMLHAADAALEKAAAKQASNISSKSTTTNRDRQKKKPRGSSHTSSHRRHGRSKRRSSDETSSCSSSASSSTETDKNDDSDDGKSSSNSSSSSSHQSKHSSRASSSKHQIRHEQRRHKDNEDYRRKSSSRHGSSNSKYGKGSKDHDRDRNYERRHDRDRHYDRRHGRGRHHRNHSHERYAATKGNSSNSSSKRDRRRYSTESDDDDYRSSSRRHNHHDKRGSRTRSRSRSRSNYSSSRSSQRRRH